MKKYVKPELFYEQYELSQHIANCKIEMVNSMDDENCYAMMDDTTGMEGFVVLQSAAVCGMEWEDYCYQPGTSQWTLLIS